MKNYVYDADRIDFTNATGGTLNAGVGVLVGTMFGVVQNQVANGADGVMLTIGVFDLAKATGQSWTAGAAIYWDNSAKNCTTTVGSNTLIGKVVGSAASGDTVGRVRINIS